MISFTNSIFALAAVQMASAALYVTFPIQGSTCAVSTPCQVKWTDNSSPPSTSTLGETAIDLVVGDAANLQTAQQLTGVSNPNTATALTFQPSPTLSPTARYAIRFIPKSNPSGVIFSTFFSITGGSGTGNATSVNTTSHATVATPNANNASTTSTISTTSISGNSSAPSVRSTTNNTAASNNASKSSSSFVEVSARGIVLATAFSLALLL